MNKQIFKKYGSHSIALFGLILAHGRANAFSITPAAAFRNVSQFNTSPVTAAAQDWKTQFGAPDGRTVSIVVKAPDPSLSTGGTYVVPAITPGTNVYSYFQNAINYVRSKSPRPSLVIFPNGNYVIAPKDAAGNLKSLHLDFSSLSDVTFDFSGSNLIFAENAPATGQVQKATTGIYIANSQRVALRNATIDWSLPGNAELAALGTIQSSSNGNVLVIDSRYPVLSPALPVQIVSLYDSANQAWVQSPTAETYFSAANYPTQSPTNPQQFNSPAFSSYKVGSTVVIRYFRFEGHGIMVTGRTTNDISLEGITLYQAPGMGFAFYNPGRGARISGCKIVRNTNDPLRLITTVSDAAHLTNSLGDIIFENNDFSMQGDDGLNLTSTVNPVQSNPTTDASGNATLTVRYANEKYAAGDLIGFFNSDMSMIGTATLISAVANGSSIVLTVDSSSASFISYVQAWSSDSTPVFRSMVSDLTLSSNRFVVRGNNLHDNRARGLLIQSANGLVQNNTLRNQTLNNAYLTASAYWGEGPGANNVRFTSNTLSNSGNNNVGSKPTMLGALVVNDATQTGNSNQQVNQYLVISGNSFDGGPGPALFIASASHLSILSNTFAHFNQQSANVTTYGTTNTNFPVVLTSAFGSFLQNNSFDLTAPAFPFGIDHSTIDALSMNVSEDAYQGDAQFNVTFDGTSIGNYTATAKHSQGQTQNFMWTGTWGKGSHRFGVTFLNDLWDGTPSTDRNLYVDGMWYDETSVTPQSAAMYSAGTSLFTWP